MHIFITVLAIVLFAIFFLVGPDRFNDGMSDVLEKGVIDTVKERMPESTDSISSSTLRLLILAVCRYLPI